MNMSKIVNLIAILEIMGGKNLEEIGRVFTNKLRAISEEVSRIEKQITGQE